MLGFSGDAVAWQEDLVVDLGGVDDDGFDFGMGA
jgi:hypothetical protein